MKELSNMEREELRAWILEHWVKERGLVTQNIAHLISGISKPEISRKVKLGKLKLFEKNGLKLLSFEEVLDLRRERKKPNQANITIKKNGEKTINHQTENKIRTTVSAKGEIETVIQQN